MGENKPNVIVVSNTTGAGGRTGDKDPIIKMPKIKADIGTLLTIGGLIVAVGGGYYLVTQLPTIMNSIMPPAQPTSSAPVSGAGMAPPIQSPIYPGTGAGSFPAPAPGQAYPGVNQQLPLQYPQLANTGVPAVATPGVQTSYHAVIGQDRYMDHRGHRRKFIGERNIKEIIGSTEKDDYEVFDLIYGE